MGENGRIMYSGRYRYILEGRGRLFIPARFRRGLGVEDDGSFVGTRGYERCIILYPLGEWRKVEEKLKESLRGEVRLRRTVRWFCSNAEVLKLDNQGRINIPQHLLEYAELKKEVMIIGVLNKIELWNPELFRKEMEETERYLGEELGLEI
jgi:MraZ protein